MIAAVPQDSFGPLRPALRKLAYSERLTLLESEFHHLYLRPTESIVKVAGRSEVLGGHTDYNRGKAFSACIPAYIIACFAARKDRIVRVRSKTLSRDVSFSLDNMERAIENPWSNYVRGVAHELMKSGRELGGADILLDSTLPICGGLSSSAALEVAMTIGFARLFGYQLRNEDAALLAKQAENGDFVRTPCGLLDQMSCASGRAGNLLLFDFSGEGIPHTEYVEAPFAEAGCRLLISYDPSVQRVLGNTGYRARRETCEASLPHLTDLLGRSVTAVAQVNPIEFEDIKAALELRGGATMRKRVEHVVYENFRVVEGVNALRNGDVRSFGSLMTLSGESALDLYELDEGAPQLRFLVEKGRAIEGVMGIRGSGGGHSALTASLVRTEALGHVKEESSLQYAKGFGRQLFFIDAELSDGVEILK